MLSFKNLENFTIMKSEKREQVKPNKKAMTSQNFQRLTRYEKELNKMSKKIQTLEQSLVDDDFDEEQINKMRLYEKEVFHLVFKIDKVLIDDNERAYDDKGADNCLMLKSLISSGSGSLEMPDISKNGRSGSLSGMEAPSESE